MDLTSIVTCKRICRYEFVNYLAHEIEKEFTRCGSHCDTSTNTIIIQCGVLGLEIEFTCCTWISLPGDMVAVLLGSLGQILINGLWTCGQPSFDANANRSVQRSVYKPGAMSELENRYLRDDKRRRSGVCYGLAALPTQQHAQQVDRECRKRRSNQRLS